MKAKITKSKVDSQKPKSKDGALKDSFVWDTEVTGFGLKVTPAGDKVFIFQYRLPGKKYPIRMTIGSYKGTGGDWTVAEARREAEVLRGAVSRGVDPRARRAAEKAARMAEKTVAQVCDAYLEAAPHIILKGKGRPKKASTLAIDESNITRHIKPLLGRKPIGSVTRDEVERFQRDVAAGKTATDVRTGPRGRARVTGGKGIAARATVVLGTIFSFAVREGYVTESPVRGVELYQIEGRERYLTSAELGRLGDALNAAEAEGVNSTAIAAVRLLIFTGCRKSEILTLKWKDVDFERGCLFLPDSKTGRKTVPLAAPALELLSTLSPAEGSPYVFPATKKKGKGKEKERGHYVGLPKVWSVIRKQAGLDDVPLHILRHSFASFAVAGGDSLFLVGKVLGHTQDRTTSKYAHLDLAPLKAVVDRAARTIGAAMTNGVGDVVELEKRKA